MPRKIAEETADTPGHVNEHCEPVFLEISVTANGGIRVRVDEHFVKQCNVEAVEEIIECVRRAMLEECAKVN